MRKIISVVALDPGAGAFYTEQVRSLFGSRAEVNGYSVRGGTVNQIIPSDLYMVSTDAFDSVDEVRQHIPMDAQMVEIHVSYRWEIIRQMKEYPRGTKALFVNFTNKMAREAITKLEQLGVNNIQFTPFYPGAALDETMEFAITPDEEECVPPGMKTVWNIGHRCCTGGTMIEAALRLGFDDMLEEADFLQYVGDIATNNYNFDEMFARSRRLESRFDILIESLDEGIVGVNERGELFACNQKAREITKVKSQLIMGRQAETIFPYLPFGVCIQSKTPVPAKVIRIGGANVNMAVIPVMQKGECQGAFATLQLFNDAENRQNELRSQLLHKGYRAKYQFHDVIGESVGITKTKEILKRMAVTESPVLLIGETGTGKELFAHAVHQASRRSEGAFVAINCAAMPENLLESELFGYEDGAFTGAKKGGKPGLFEFAHRGTIFLDEVEGMSPALQVKLLRVLQEREIMRVGGHQIICIDVRIVAATNEHLEQKVEEGSFRRDLYYRLNTLPVLIPPLRERGADRRLLLERFRDEIGGEFCLSEELEDLLSAYSWPGNIRELRNLVEYFSYTGSELITIEDLPPTFSLFAKPDQSFLSPARRPAAQDWNGSFEAWFVLEQLYLASDQIGTGREAILKEAREQHMPISQQEVRNTLAELSQLGFAKVSRGRGGSRITPKGRDVWEKHKVVTDLTN